MNRFRKKITTPVFILIVLMIQIAFSQDNVRNESWKIQLQILLGFTGEEVDGVLGEATFNSLKKFAIKHDLTDVVLRGEFEDIEYWGFEQYLIKYQAYWIRELKNQQIMNDVRNKHYIRQADETLYSFYYLTYSSGPFEAIGEFKIDASSCVVYCGVRFYY